MKEYFSNSNLVDFIKKKYESTLDPHTKKAFPIMPIKEFDELTKQAEEGYRKRSVRKLLNAKKLYCVPYLLGFSGEYDTQRGWCEGEDSIINI